MEGKEGKEKQRPGGGLIEKTREDRQEWEGWDRVDRALRGELITVCCTQILPVK